MRRIPTTRVRDEPIAGLLVGGAVVIANAASALLGREVNRARTLSPLTVTCLRMGVGAAALLEVGIGRGYPGSTCRAGPS